VFIHHNTLHAFQHLHFEEAVVEASRLYGTEAFMSEDAYRECLASGRIQVEDVDSVLSHEATHSILPGRLDRRKLWRTLLLGGQRRFDAATIDWYLEETSFSQRFRADLAAGVRTRLIGNQTETNAAEALFAACLELAEEEACAPHRPTRPKDGLLWRTGVDLDDVVHPLLIRLCSVFLDQGVAYWSMPNRRSGFLNSVRELMSRPGAVFPEYLGTLGTEFRRQSELGMDAASVVEIALERFGVPEDEWEPVLKAESLALPGWAGMMRRLEEEADLAPHEQLPCSLMEFLAVRLTLELAGASGIARRCALGGLTEWRFATAPFHSSGAERKAQAARLFDAFQLLGLGAREIASLNSISRQALVDEIESFEELERRRIYHLAYELRHELDVLRPLARYRQLHPPKPWTTRPSAQVFFCIDEREESTRRHLEEIAPEVETHSAAGFFGVAINYAGIDDAHGVSLCPVVIKPQHAVRERPMEDHEESHAIRRRRRRHWAKVVRNMYVSSRSLCRGWVSTAALGIFSLPSTSLRLLAPRHYGRLRRLFDDAVLPQPRTELNFVRAEVDECAAGQLLQGFTLKEMIGRVESVLGPAGFRRGFARIVVVLGHGSTSLNNPHESAHDCGACGGRRGGPNGRLFAAMANHPDVRQGLQGLGIHIPEDTVFVGGYHDTANDDVDLFDTDCIPPTHRADLDKIRTQLDRARQLDAQERARRFEAAHPDDDPGDSLRHVQERAQHLAEPRPEYGHCTNAVCIVGRRAVTRGLFLDRRAFLISYDPTLDPTNESLARLMGAAGPVCAGISLEYYFSFVDNEGYGCGTKLPHNITGLIGVMNGHASDLRTGLPWQMVEIHEPVRILFVVESTPERVMSVISANAGLSELLENRWIRLATLDPESGIVHVRRGKNFEKLDGTIDQLPSAPSSIDWFRGKLEHLPIAHITPNA